MDQTRIFDLLLKNREDNQVVHGHLGDVRLVGNGPSSASSHGLVLGVHGTVILNAVRRASRARPVLGVALAIRPLAGKLSVEGQASLSLVVGELNSELATSRQSNGGTVRRRGLVAATVGLHPPLFKGKIPERVYGSVGVGVVVVGIGTTLDGVSKNMSDDCEERKQSAVQTSQYMPLTKAAVWAVAPEARASATGTVQNILTVLRIEVG